MFIHKFKLVDFLYIWKLVLFSPFLGKKTVDFRTSCGRFDGLVTEVSSCPLSFLKIYFSVKRERRNGQETGQRRIQVSKFGDESMEDDEYDLDN